MNKKKSLEEFFLDINCLDPIISYFDTVNPFEIMKIGKAEIRHSNVLAWLLNPSGSHHAGDVFLRNFVLHILGNIPDNQKEKWAFCDYNNFVVKREYSFCKNKSRRYIDLLLLNKKEKLLICIENKIDAKDGKNQLSDYKEFITKEFKDYTKLFAFLTPDGHDPENNKDNKWTCLSYEEDIMFCLEELKPYLKIDAAKKFVEQYKYILRRYVMEDEELIEKCREIYYKHKEAFDAIYDAADSDNAYYREEIKKNLKSWIEKQGKSFKFHLVEEKSRKALLVLSHDDLDKYLPTDSSPEGNWNDGKYYHIVFFCRDNLNKGKLQIRLEFDTKRENDKIKKLSDDINNIKENKGYCIYKGMETEPFDLKKLDFDKSFKKLFDKISKTVDAAVNELKQN